MVKAKTQKNLFSVKFQNIITWFTGILIIVGLLTPLAQNVISSGGSVWQLGLTNVSTPIYMALMMFVGVVIAWIKKWKNAAFQGALLVLTFLAIYFIVEYISGLFIDHYELWRYLNDGHRMMIELAIALVASTAVFVSWKRTKSPIETRSFWWYFSILSLGWLALQILAITPSSTNNLLGAVQHVGHAEGSIAAVTLWLILFGTPIFNVIVYLINIFALWKLKSGALRLMLAGLGVSLATLTVSQFQPLTAFTGLHDSAMLRMIFVVFVLAAVVDFVVIYTARKSVKA